jgi:hypothetical protein
MERDREREYVTGGKGRKDEVGGSGIYPASAPNVPADAEIRSEGGLVDHRGPRRESTEKQSDAQTDKTDETAGSE